MQIDWEAMFVPSLHLFDLIARGTLTYLFLFLLFRLLRREAGAIGIPDLLVIVLVADAAQNAMSHEYISLTEGAVLVSTIAFWDYFLDWLGYRFPRIGRLLQPPPLLLIKDGCIQKRNLRREMLTEENLVAELRKQGIHHVNRVKRSYMESDGSISVITVDREPRKPPAAGHNLR